MPYSNKHLIEVICSFEFIDEGPKWDSIYFGSYYEKIKLHGFTERQERKGIMFQMFPTLANSSLGPMSPVQSQGEQIIFKNSNKNWGITLAKSSISFHVLKDYTQWENFRNDFIKPFYDFYLELGLGTGLRNCSVMYLNRLQKSAAENLSDYFTIISPLDRTFGAEQNTLVQRIFKGENDNFLIAKLNAFLLPNNLNNILVNLECGAISLASAADWLDQANNTHAPIQKFFESIIKEKLREEL